MRKNSIAILLFIAILLGNTDLFSQESTGGLNAIQTVVPFLTIAPDSRAGAMWNMEHGT